MEGINSVKGEIHNVLTVLRLEGRVSSGRRSIRRGSSAGTQGGFSFFFGSDADDSDQENAIVRGFKDLNDSLGFYRDLNEFDTCDYLRPFLAVLVSDETSPHLTITSLQSIHKFLLYKLIHKDSPRVAQAVANISHAVNQCTFQKTSQEADEVLYMKKLEVFLELLRCPAGHLLTNQHVCHMVEDCFNIRSGVRTSAVLRKYAENMFSQMVLLIFAQLVPDDVIGNDEEKSASTATDSPSKVENPQSDAASVSSAADNAEISSLQQVPSPNVSPSPSPTNKQLSDPASVLTADAAPNGVAEDSDEVSSPRDSHPSAENRHLPDVRGTLGAPYGIPALHRVFQFLTHLINPVINRRNSEEIREFGLRLINTALESCGRHIGTHQELMSVVQDDLCKQLLHCSQTENLKILSLTLRIVFDLFNTVKEHLKVQLEVFFTSIYLRIAESDSSSIDQRELVLESLVEMCHEPDLIVGLYRNYDCEMSSTNLYEDLIKFMSQTATKNSDTITQMQLLAGEGILSVMDSISKRFASGNLSSQEDNPAASPDGEGLSAAEEAKLRQTREEKKRLHKAAQSFNELGKNSFPYLQKIKVISTPPTAKSVAAFLRYTPSGLIDKVAIGEFLASSKPFGIECMNAYVDSFTFTGMTIDKALRLFLDSFTLRGDSEQILRILERFSEHLYAQSPGPIQGSDAMYILVSAILMLHTDAHNDNVKVKMQPQQFKNVLRGTNKTNDAKKGEDFPEKFLDDIYHSITTNEIKSPPEDLRTIVRKDHGVDSRAWGKLLRKSRRKGGFVTHAPAGHGYHMFGLVWDSAIHVLCFHLKTSDHPKMNSRIEEGFHTFARICQVYELNAIFNNLLISLSNILCDLLERCSMDPDGYEPITAFGMSDRAQRVTSLLFVLTIAYGENIVHDAWSNIIHAILWLRHLELLPASTFEHDDFLDSSGCPLPSLRFSDHSDRIEGTSGGLENAVSSAWQSFTSFLAPHADESANHPEDSMGSNADEEMYKRRAFDCIASLEVQKIFEFSRHFQSKSLSHLVQTLVLVSNTATHRTDATSGFNATVLNQEAAIFCLERLTQVVDCNQNRLGELLPTVKKHLEDIYANPRFSPPTYYTERAVVNLLRVCVMLILSEKGDFAEDIMTLLDLLLHLDDKILQALGDRISAGLIVLLRTDTRCFKTARDWDIILSLLRRFPRHRKAAVGAFQAIDFIVGAQINASNFLPCLNALSSFVGTQASESLIKPSHTISALLNLHRGLSQIQRRLNTPELLAESTLQDAPPAGDQKSTQDANAAASAASLVDELWEHSIKNFCLLCQDGRYAVRKHALDCLSRALLAMPDIHIESPESWRKCFEDHLIPLLTELYKMETERIARHPRMRRGIPPPRGSRNSPGPQGRPANAPEAAAVGGPPTASGVRRGTDVNEPPEDLRLRISNLLFQTFLHNVNTLVKLEHFHLLWLRFIGSLERYMRDAGTDSSSELLSMHFIESLRNVLHVLQTSGIFFQASKTSGQDLWALTWTVIGSYRPELRKELQQSDLLRASVPPEQQLPQQQPQQQPPVAPGAQADASRAQQPPAVNQSVDAAQAMQHHQPPPSTAGMTSSQHHQLQHGLPAAGAQGPPIPPQHQQFAHAPSHQHVHPSSVSSVAPHMGAQGHQHPQQHFHIPSSQHQVPNTQQVYAVHTHAHPPQGFHPSQQTSHHQTRGADLKQQILHPPPAATTAVAQSHFGVNGSGSSSALSHASPSQQQQPLPDMGRGGDGRRRLEQRATPPVHGGGDDLS